MKISIFGIGYVGLVQGAIFAEAGHQVICVDVDEKKITDLRSGIVPIFEPGLDLILKSALSDGRIKFVSDAYFAVKNADIHFIAVGTPQSDDGSADLTFVLAVAKVIASHITSYSLIVDKSTVPVGTADLVSETIAQILKERGVQVDFDVVSNPEFLKEGSAVSDSQRPDRIVIGTSSARAENLIREVYEPFNRNHDKIIVMSTRSAEMTKYAANCMLATRISLMNELAIVAEGLGADIESVRQGIGSDQRIGYQFIYAGAGYGGSCFPKDISALIRSAQNTGMEPFILNAVEARNVLQKRVIFDKLYTYFKGELQNKAIALWGLAFKPNTDDMREAPSRVLMEALWEVGASVQAYDPVAMDEAQRIYGSRPDLMLCGTKEAAIQDADALVIMTEWRQFKAPDFDAISKGMIKPVIFDGRNLFDPEKIRQKGIEYYGIGRI